jgi:antitoxin CptB
MAATVDREHRIKRLRFRAWHRGTREMDLLMGRFADASLETMSEAQLERFEALMERPDPEVYGWLVGRTEVPSELRDDVIELILNFHKSD